MPGPFDYDAGICRIEGLGKYGALYNADLRAELGSRLAPALGAAAADIRFQNDVAAFALGELRFGCARGTGRGLFVCIGTGCGSAFSLGDGLAPEGTPGMPAGGYLYPLPLRGLRVDDWLSRRGLQRLSRQTLGEELDGLPLAQRARAGDAGALAVWQQFGALLAEALTPGAGRLPPAALLPGRAGHRQRDAVFGPAAQGLPAAGRPTGDHRRHQPAGHAGRAGHLRRAGHP